MEENDNELSEEQTKGESESLEVPKQKRKVFTDQGDPEIDPFIESGKTVI